ncbi:MAG: hypothetical protein QM768_11425 [Agriterribacter sp.]
MHKILFLSFEFHPVQSTGNFRAAKFVKHLKSYGIEPIVFCGSVDDLKDYYSWGKLNNELLKDIPSDIEFFRPQFKRKYKPWSKYLQFLYYADPVYHYWKKSAKEKLKEIFSIHPDIEAVFATVPPFSINELAYWISKKYKLPLILDLRDAWSDQGQVPYFTRVHYLINKFYEKRILKQAKKVVFVTKGLEKIYASSYPSVLSKSLLVYNNYDNYFFDKEIITSFPAKEQEKFIIGYIGAFYYDVAADEIRKQKWWKRKGIKKFFYYAAQEEWIYRSPFFLFAAMEKLFKKHPHLKAKFLFGYIGNKPPWLEEMAGRFELKENIKCYGFSNVHEIEKLVSDFNALLITTEKIPGNQSFCLPSKMFDYIKFGKPLIGFVKEGDLKNFLLLSNMSVIVDPDKINEESELAKLESFVNEKKVFTPDISYINTYKTEYQTALLAEGIISAIES